MCNLNDRIAAGTLDAELVVVIASRECKGLQRARTAGLPAHLVPYRELRDVEDYSRRIAALLDEANVELVVLAGLLSFWQVPDRYAGRVMNIHPALLPSFGGPGMYGHHVHEAVLARGCKVSGCTVHFVTNEYDAGPIIAQRCVPVLEDDDADRLAARVFLQECEAYPQAIQLFAEGRLRIEGQRVRVK